MKVKMLVASHKPYKMPKNTNIYFPVFVGAALNKNVPEGFQPDNEGENISSKNPYFNELTAIYWAWKNLSADIIGVNQYRRYFVSTKKSTKDFSEILTLNQIENLVNEDKIIVPQKRHYYIETIESHYLHTHSEQGLDSLKEVFSSYSKNYQKALDGVLQSRSAHMFNMFVMTKANFDEYCTWLFNVLFQVEKKIDYSKLVGNEKRVLGFLSEFLLDVWINVNDKSFTEVPVLFMEKNHWPKKILIFLVNKVFGGKAKINTHIK